LRRLLLTASLLWSTASAAASPLDEKLAAIAHGSPSSVGIFVEHLERHETAAVNGTRMFPLASTFKLPLALVVLRAIERQELPSLDSQIRIEESDLIDGVSPLCERLPKGGLATLREVIALMLEEGDNNAANALMRLAGGASSVRAALTSMGLTGVSIDRDETEMNLDAFGLPYPAVSERTPRKLSEMMRAVPVERHRRTLAAFFADPRDHGSPMAMTKIIERVWRPDLLNAADLDFVRQELARNQRGPRRIRAGVPSGVPVADRTGSCGGMDDADAPCVNDVGVITLPSGEHVALAVYVADAGGRLAPKEQLVAKVTRAVWDYFVKRTGKPKRAGD
jgi:beta-lactamase class A